MLYTINILDEMQIVSNPMMSGFVEETPLAHACAQGFLNIVKLLISYGADVNFRCSVSYDDCSCY